MKWRIHASKGELNKMKDKLLNAFSTESNGEIIRVNFLETDKGLVIDINGKSMDVFINDEEFYSKYDKEEYKYIPSHLRSFVEENICTYGDGLRKEGSDVQCDLLLEGREYFLKIPTKKAKKNNLTLTDWLIDYEQLAEDEKIVDVKIEEQKYEEFLNNIKSYGYQMKVSHSGNDYDNWFNLVVPIGYFNIEKVKICLKLWQDYNQYLIDTYLEGKY
jgi:hypothetical protein